MRHVLLLCLICVIAAPIADADSCLVAGFDTAWRKSTAVFVGRVVDRDGLNGGWRWLWARVFDKSPCGPKTVTMRVERSWRGHPNPEVRVFSEDACQGLGSYLSLGSTYLVFAYPPPKESTAEFRADNCSGTAPIELSAENIKLLDKAASPAAALDPGIYVMRIASGIGAAREQRVELKDFLKTGAKTATFEVHVQAASRRRSSDADAQVVPGSIKDGVFEFTIGFGPESGVKSFIDPRKTLHKLGFVAVDKLKDGRFSGTVLPSEDPLEAKAGLIEFTMEKVTR